MTGQGAKGWIFAAAGALSLAACNTTAQYGLSDAEFTSLEYAVRGHIETLASDSFGGRKPGTRFEALTLDYIEAELAQAGYKSGTNDPGNFWRAPVALASSTPIDWRIELNLDGKVTPITGDAAGAYTSRKRSLVEAGSLLFVGRQANSLAEDDVRGNVIIMLSEPGLSPQRREILFEKGAAAIITVVADQAAMDSVAAFYGNERIGLVGEDDGRLVAFATRDAMRTALGPEIWDRLLAKLEDGGVDPVRLEHSATIEANSTRRTFRSHNIIGRLEGRRPETGAILLMAHWDHFGECGAPDAADRLCNGAIDNASGVAVMIELAKRLAQAGPHDRDIYVLGTTAEEWGLLGAKAFVQSPPLPLDQIVAAFNFDTLALAPRGAPIGFVGQGKTPLDPIILEAVERSRRKLGDRGLADQFINRQDGIVLLDEGVPTVVLANSLGDMEVVQSYLSSKYHQPNDEADGIELGGAVDDLLLHLDLINRLADSSQYP